MQVTMTMEEYTKLITANAKQVEQLNKLMEKYDKLNDERFGLLKRSDGCDFCNGERDYWIHRLEVDLINDKLNFSYNACACGSFEDSKLVINYCPMCGKKLEK